jgi:hypothetical protein
MRMSWAVIIARMEERRYVYTLLVRRPEGKRLLGRRRRRWVDDIKLDLVDVGWSGVDWIGVA